MTGGLGAAGGGRGIGVSGEVDRANPQATDPSLWWWRGQGWPHVDPEVRLTHAPSGQPATERPPKLHEFYPLRMNATYGLPNWAPYTYSRALLHEFAIAFDATWVKNRAPRDLGFVDPLTDTWSFGESAENEHFPDGKFAAGPSYALDDELIELVGLIEYRPGVIGEAFQQANVMDQYFSGILTFNRISHPHTAKLVALAVEVGTHVSMMFKAHFNRPRPSQLCPSLMPPIDPPEHAAFPSGHATQAWLVALLLDDAMDGTLGKPQLPPDTTVTKGALTNPLYDMAQRIARNREIMGLHYPSDSEAGKRLAYAAFATIKSFQSGPIDSLLDLARTEW
jgi:hypothetical protein